MEDAVRVTIVRSGGEDVITSLRGGRAAKREGCAWSLVYAPELEDAPYGISPGPMPHPDAKFALLLCNGTIVQPIWVAPDDIVDVDALARDLADQYIEDVLEPDVTHRREPGGPRPGRARLVVLGRGLRWRGDGAPDRGLRAHDRRPHARRAR